MWRPIVILYFLATASALGDVTCIRTRPARMFPPRATVALGKSAQFRVVAKPSATEWRVVEPYGHGIVTQDGLYHAPFFRPGLPEATIEASIASQPPATASARVTLIGTQGDTADCFAPGQHTQGYVEFVELPEAILKVPPSYPDSARQAGIEGTVRLQALVCYTGLIARTRIVASIPALDAAAEEAVRQWVFKPATADGRSIAVWVAIPVKFTLH